jgi:hypothetical protein
MVKTAKHQVPAESYAISSGEFKALALKFRDEYANKEVPEGVDVYIAAQKWFFTPAKIITDTSFLLSVVGIDEGGVYLYLHVIYLSNIREAELIRVGILPLDL